MVEIWVPVTALVSTTIVIASIFWFRYRTRCEMQNTIRAAIDKGQQLNPELIESLFQPKKVSKDKDLRFGLVWLAVALGISLFGLAIGAAEAEEEVFLIMSGIAALPFMVGVAYLTMWKFTEPTQ